MSTVDAHKHIWYEARKKNPVVGHSVCTVFRAIVMVPIAESSFVYFVGKIRPKYAYCE